MYHINLGIAYWQNGSGDLGYKEIEIGKKLKRKSAPKSTFLSSQSILGREQ